MDGKPDGRRTIDIGMSNHNEIRSGDWHTSEHAVLVKRIPAPFRTILGEGPVWLPRDQAVMWVDIFGESIHRLDLESGKLHQWSVGERIGWIVPRKGNPGYFAGLKSGFAFVTLAPFQLRRLRSPEPERPYNRLNDAKVDPAGRLWAGSKDDTDTQASGALYRLDSSETEERCDDGYRVANGPTFSPDGKTLYHADTGLGLVYAFDLSATGILSNRRIFVRFEDDWGYPDGMTTDARGGVWIAHWDGGRISRFDPSGRLDRTIHLPTKRVTSMAFGGSDLDRLFVTTAAFGLEGDPLAGSLFEVDTGERGLPPVAFNG